MRAYWQPTCCRSAAPPQTLDSLIKQLDGALYLDDEAWQQALPHAQFTAALQVGGEGAGLGTLACHCCRWPGHLPNVWRCAPLPSTGPTAAVRLQGQQRKIAELEQQVQALVVKLEASERARAAAEERCRRAEGVERFGWLVGEEWRGVSSGWLPPRQI